MCHFVDSHPLIYLYVLKNGRNMAVLGQLTFQTTLSLGETALCDYTTCMYINVLQSKTMLPKNASNLLLSWCYHLFRHTFDMQLYGLDTNIDQHVGVIMFSLTSTVFSTGEMTDTCVHGNQASNRPDALSQKLLVISFNLASMRYICKLHLKQLQQKNTLQDKFSKVREHHITLR